MLGLGRKEGENSLTTCPRPFVKLWCSRPYQKRHPAQTSFTTESQGVETPNGKRQLSSLGLKHKYFWGSALSYVRETGSWHFLWQVLQQAKKFSKILSQTEKWPRMEKSKTQFCSKWGEVLLQEAHTHCHYKYGFLIKSLQIKAVLSNRTSWRWPHSLSTLCCVNMVLV